MENHLPVLGIVVPCYNEEDIIQHSILKLKALLDQYVHRKLVSNSSFIGVIDDRSRDHTWDHIKALTSANSNLKALRLASNRGHQFALLAGILEFGEMTDCLVSVDADLQDDVSVIEIMLERFLQGNDIVFGVRSKRNLDSAFKRITARSFYRLLRVFGVKVFFDHADFRLTSRRVNNDLKGFSEVNLFLRGIFPLMGYNTALVPYERHERLAGKTKYPLQRMISLALDGITSFSVAPLRFITFLGFGVFLICLLLMGYAIWAYFAGQTIAGWFSTVLPFYFLGGVQILCIGILGEYLGKVYKEVKRRPRYIIDERIV
jgi:glycosyltransferase involved in cell wall biosynthesis